MLIVQVIDHISIDRHQVLKVYFDVCSIGVGIENGHMFYVIRFSDPNKEPANISDRFEIRIQPDYFLLHRSSEDE